MSRTIEEVQRDYAATATQLGDIEYRLGIMAEDSKKLRRAMKQLNVEAQSIRNEEENKKAAEAASEQKSEA